jgi:hypothetical protein
MHFCIENVGYGGRYGLYIKDPREEGRTATPIFLRESPLEKMLLDLDSSLDSLGVFTFVFNLAVSLYAKFGALPRINEIRSDIYDCYHSLRYRLPNSLF